MYILFYSFLTLFNSLFNFLFIYLFTYHILKKKIVVIIDNIYIYTFYLYI